MTKLFVGDSVFFWEGEDLVETKIIDALYSADHKDNLYISDFDLSGKILHPTRIEALNSMQNAISNQTYKILLRKKPCEIILRARDRYGTLKNSGIELHMDDPEFLNKVKQHIELFKTIVNDEAING